MMKRSIKGFASSLLAILFSQSANAGVLSAVGEAFIGLGDSIVAVFLIGIVQIALIFLVGVMALSIVVADVALMVCYAFGPLCIAFYPFVKQWTGNVLNMAAAALITKPIAMLLASACLEALDVAVKGLGPGISNGIFPSSAAALSMVAVCLLMSGVMLQVGSLASGLFGGGGLDAMSAGRGVSRAAQGFKSIKNPFKGKGKGGEGGEKGGANKGVGKG